MNRTAVARVRADESTVREKLHAAAAQVFARKGYAAASVQEIVARAGVTKPVLYYHYGNKEGIYRAVLAAALDDFEARVGTVEMLAGSARIRLHRLFGEVFVLFHRHLDVVRLMHSIYYGPPQGAPAFDFDRAVFRLHDTVLKLVRQGQKAGEFQGDAQAMTLALLGACNECIDLELVHPRMAVDAAGFGRVLDVVLRGMRKKV